MAICARKSSGFKSCLKLVTGDVDQVLYDRLFQTVGALPLKAFDNKDRLTVGLFGKSMSDQRISLTG